MMRRPAEAAGIEFGDDPTGTYKIDAQLAAEAAAEPGALPMLSFLLDALYKKDIDEGNGESLTYASMRELGGLRGAIAQRAEETFTAQPPEVRQALMKLLHALVTVSGSGAEPSARVARMADFGEGSPQRKLADALIAARLLVSEGDAEVARVRLAHEALLSHWERARQQVAQDRDDLRIRAALEAAEAEWRGASGDRAYLLHGPQLANALDLVHRWGEELVPALREFVARSDAAARAAARRTRVVTASIIVGLTALLVATLVGFQIARNERRVAQLNLADGLLAEGDALALAQRYSEAISRIEESILLRTRLRAPMLPAEAALWDVYRQSPPPLASFRVPEYAGSVNSAAFSPDGRTALSGSEDKRLRLWNVITGRQLHTFEGHSAPVNSVAFSPDGHTALSGSGDQTLRLWDVTTGGQLRIFQGHSANVNSVAFSPDGRTALSGSDDGTLKLWDVSTGLELRTFHGHTGSVKSVAFSPDGRAALSGSWDNTLKLWDVSTGRELRTFHGHTSTVSSVKFSRDGHLALSGSWDNTLKLWNVNTGRELRTFRGHTGAVDSVAFSPDDPRALSSSLDRTLKLWDVNTGREIQAFQGDTVVKTGRKLHPFLVETGDVESVSFNPDGHTALSSGIDTLQLWDVSTGRELQTFHGHTGSVESVAFSPDGRTALSGSMDYTVKLWDVSTGRELQSFQTGFDSSVAFGPGGRTALSGRWGTNVGTVWDLSTGQELRKVQALILPSDSTAPSADGLYVLSVNRDNMLELFEVGSQREVHTFHGYSDHIISLVFSPDGSSALSGSRDDNTLKLWDFSRAFTYFSFEAKLYAAQRALGANPNDASGLLTLGEWYAFRGLDDWAVDLLERARSLGSDVSPLTLGRSYWNLNELPQARQESKLL